MYVQIKNELSRSMLSTVAALQTDTHADRREITAPAFVGGKNQMKNERKTNSAFCHPCI